MIAIRIIQVIAALAGLAALALGLTFWIAQLNFIGFHLLFGLLLTLALLVMSILALSTKSLRIWGIVGIVYALIVPIFGMTHSGILTGNLHWLIQAAHMLVSMGAGALTSILSARYVVLKQTTAKPSAQPQAVR
ncbi:hypothetical protein KSD_01470 [Ktedonobacter sp. SOSP1-85]|uniref:hypothetical protein n=1 Tax=Ktedonobacter sp. SOSP1-85 TaxID=2778367 RepID=UPI0019160F55|nr:hypothetical protein [Ktedonobacter sp. SOSP1-85]GHO72376.1 hypothetical protein KSD_01470 [Ktedonobacter sp. SOSP1-85]